MSTLFSHPLTSTLLHQSRFTTTNKVITQTKPLGQGEVLPIGCSSAFSVKLWSIKPHQTPQITTHTRFKSWNKNVFACTIIIPHRYPKRLCTFPYESSGACCSCQSLHKDLPISSYSAPPWTSPEYESLWKSHNGIQIFLLSDISEDSRDFIVILNKERLPFPCN